jgi:hypothetical protein
VHFADLLLVSSMVLWPQGRLFCFAVDTVLSGSYALSIDILYMRKLSQ